MWLCTQFGFYSIVQKLPGEYHVRARVKRDLENLCTVCDVQWRIHRSANADYRWRIVVGEIEIAEIFATLSTPENLDYTNFKSRIRARADQCAKAPAYSALWADLHDLQERAGVGPRGVHP